MANNVVNVGTTISTHRSRNHHGPKRKTTSFIRHTNNGATNGQKFQNSYLVVQTMPSRITGIQRCDANMKESLIVPWLSRKRMQSKVRRAKKNRRERSAHIDRPRLVVWKIEAFQTVGFIMTTWVQSLKKLQ